MKKVIFLQNPVQIKYYMIILWLQKLN